MFALFSFYFPTEQSSDTVALMSTKYPASLCVSLGCGEFPDDGPVTFQPSPAAASAKRTLFRSNAPSREKKSFRHASDSMTLHNSLSNENCVSVCTIETMQSLSENDVIPDDSSPKKSPLVALAEKLTVHRPVLFQRHVSSFMRAADLGLSEKEHSFHKHNEEQIHANFHHPSVDPPPGMDRDANETWVALDDGAGSHSPVAPFAVRALANNGFNSAMDQSMWTPEKKTDRLLRSHKGAVWNTCIWQKKGSLCIPPKGSLEETENLVWTGTFKHSYYGSDLPAIRALGIVNMSARALLDLLLDSTRVKEYNKMSIGRKDLLVLQDNMDEDGPFGPSVTKIMRSESKPPLLRKILQFVSLLHARELEDGTGYLIVTRAVTQASNAGPLDSNILSSEILLGVNVIRRVEGDDNRCLMINVNHLRSPMVPMMIAKKLGLTAACGFIDDIRKLC